jgi:hypothetical protein
MDLVRSGTTGTDAWAPADRNNHTPARHDRARESEQEEESGRS